MKKIGSVFILILLLSSAFRSDNRLKFYWGEKVIKYNTGISMAEINQSKNTNKLHFAIREDLIQEVGSRTTKVEINLVRNGASIYAYRFDNVLSNRTLKIHSMYSALRVGDTILIQFKGVEGILPQIIGLKIKE